MNNRKEKQRVMERSQYDKFNMKKTFEKSIVSSRSIEKSEVIDERDLAFKKPGDGIPAREYNKILGKRINKCINKDYQFTWTDFEP